jgi:hypothetical protein
MTAQSTAAYLTESMRGMVERENLEGGMMKICAFIGTPLVSLAFGANIRGQR